MLLFDYAPETLFIPLGLLYLDKKLTAIVTMVILLYIFRKGTTNPDKSQYVLISPAEGLVDNISKYKNGYVISIFLNPIDRHYQICPVDGIVESVDYIQGSFKAAFNNISTTNERVETIIKNKYFGRVVIVQVAGYLFRRIRNILKKGDEVKKGDFMGLIKFSSKVEIRVPEKVKLLIKRGDKIKLGQSLVKHN